MKKKYYYIAITLILFGCSSVDDKKGVDEQSNEPQPTISKEDLPNFISTGAVVTFEQICLLTYPDRNTFQKWQEENSSNEITDDSFKNNSSDKTYKIRSPVVSFVLNVEEGNSCTIFSEGTDRAFIDKNISIMLNQYLSGNNGGKLVHKDISKNGKYSKNYMIVSPKGVPYIDIIYSDSKLGDGSQRSAITGATVRRNE